MTGWGALRFNVARFRRHPGTGPPLTPAPTLVEFDVVVPAEGLHISTARVPDGTPIAVQGGLAAGVSEFEAHLHLRTDWEGECRRCLEPVHGVLDLDAGAAFVDAALADRGLIDDADVYPIDDDHVDVGVVVREEIMLALPLSPLCSGACVGADPERFPTSAASRAEDDTETGEIDPRWAPLADLTFDED